jgi:hypothetical protein
MNAEVARLLLKSRDAPRKSTPRVSDFYKPFPRQKSFMKARRSIAFSVEPQDPAKRRRSGKLFAKRPRLRAQIPC